MSCLTRLFHGPTSRRTGVSFSNITVKWMNGFLWNIQDMSALAQEPIWNILGMMRSTFWTQGLFFYFGGQFLLAASGNNG